MTNCRFILNKISLIGLLSLTALTNGINTNDKSNVDETKWTDNILLTSGSIIGAVCLLSLVMIYSVLHFKRRSLIFKKNETQLDEEKGTIENTLDELFKSTNDDDEFKKDQKPKSIPCEDQRKAKVQGFLLRAMTLPQSVIQSVGKIQTIQITEPSSNVEQSSISSKTNVNQQNLISSSGNSPSGNGSLISTTCTPTQVERPANFKNKPTAVKSPQSNYLKKSPSPTGQKSPPQSQNTETLIDKQEIGSNVKAEDTPSTSKDTNSIDNQSAKLELDDSSGEFKLGKLQFCLKYNYEKHAITVSTIKCMCLPGKNTMNTYVKLQLLPEKKHKVKTRTIRKNQNPNYQEDFTFFNIQPQQLDNLALHFMIMSFDRYSRDEILGEVLHPCSDQFDTIEKQICVTLDISPKGLLSKAQGRGEILLSLCYHPANALLSLVVLKAKNLQKENITGLPDPYVKINLLINNKRISKKKTHPKKRTLNPIYNEIFSFQLSDYLSNSQITDANDDYVDPSLWENIKLELFVVDNSVRITRNEYIGSLSLSIVDKDANVRKHMKDMLDSPRKQIAMWHKIS